MIEIKKSEERGKTEIEWLKSYHSFSFGEYYNPQNINFGALRVINDDYIKGGGGFPKHPHRDMEILTYVISGALNHHDSMGNGRTIHAGELQMMSAGSGIRHSEANDSETEDVHLLQIWITPEKASLVPSYAEWFAPENVTEKKLLMASSDARLGSVKINQNADLYICKMDNGELNEHQARWTRSWIQLIAGQIDVNGQKLYPGDAAAITNEAKVKIEAKDSSEFLLFDLD